MIRICVFYSKGRGFLDVLRAVRAQYPLAALYAMVPPDYPVSDEERALISEVVQTEKARYSLSGLGPLLRLVRRIRAARYDVFVITFNSPKLNVLAALSGARRCIYCSLDGRLNDIQPGVIKVFADIAYRAVRGRLTYATIWLAVHCLKVGRRRS